MDNILVYGIGVLCIMILKLVFLKIFIAKFSKGIHSLLYYA